MNMEDASLKFRAKIPIYERLKEEALYVLERALAATDIKLHSVLSRVKRFDSVVGKVERKQLVSFEDVSDIVGLRVVCLFVSDIDRIGKVIREIFSILNEDNKVDGAEVSSFGYMSVHFIVEMKEEYKGPRYDSIAKLPFEIQVRTIAMDAWANVSHYLEYKSDVDVPKDLRRDFYALSGLFYVADRHFEMFMKSSLESRENLVTAFERAEAPLQQDINHDSLAAYLLNRFPDRTHSDAKYISELISELSGVGIKSIAEIDEAVTHAWEAFLEYEKDSGLGTNVKYADVGVIRGILDLTNKRFREARGIPLARVKRYEHLIKK